MCSVCCLVWLGSLVKCKVLVVHACPGDPRDHKGGGRPASMQCFCDQPSVLLQYAAVISRWVSPVVVRCAHVYGTLDGDGMSAV